MVRSINVYMSIYLLIYFIFSIEQRPQFIPNNSINRLMFLFSFIVFFVSFLYDLND